MHIGVISLCDRVAHNINTNEIKQDILDEIEKRYGTKIIQRHFHKLTDESVKHITATPHLVSIRTNGNPYYMYFTMYDDKEIIYLIDKKIHTGYKYPRIQINRGMFNQSLFSGTLIDGEMVRCYDKSWIFLMNDIIAYKGEHLINHMLPARMEILMNMLDKEYTPDSTMDMCNYAIKPYYNLCVDTLEKIVSKKYAFSIRGIFFWAYNLKYKPKQLNFDDSLIQMVSRKVKDNPDFILKEPPVVIKTFVQTDLPDVYRVIEDDTYACIQTTSNSQLVRDVFKNTSVNKTKQFRCTFNVKFQKWQPQSFVE